jgi:LasA protease
MNSYRGDPCKRRVSLTPGLGFIRYRAWQVAFLGCLLLGLTAGLACNLSSPRRSPFDLTVTVRSTFAFQVFPSSVPTTSDLPIAPPSPSPEVFASPLPPQSTAISYPFWGLHTATAGPRQPYSGHTPEPEVTLPPVTYWTQPGDTLPALAARFDVSPEQISAAQTLPTDGLLPPGLQLAIPNVLGELPYPSALLPDSAIVYSPDAAGFRVETFAAQAGGYLSTYGEEVEPGDRLSGPEIVQRVALETSVNPQLLLTFLEYRSHWVLGQPADPSMVDYPIGFYVPEYIGLYKELSLVAKMLNIGYYGWRQGTLIELEFPDHTHIRLSPGLNAGSVALQTLASKFYSQQAWLDTLFGPRGLLALYHQLFGDPWQSAARIGPIFPTGLAQPALELPFAPGQLWKLTAGPHTAWTTGTPRGALDFAPITGEPPCAVSTAWVTASAPGLVVRSEHSVVAIDLDGDGLEQTGWVLIYIHLAEDERIATGRWVDVDAPLGHPSCEGGTTTGRHVHLARKYNGEWLAADGPLPLVLSGWVAHAGEGPFEGTLVKDGQTVFAAPDGSHNSTIVR